MASFVSNETEERVNGSPQFTMSSATGYPSAPSHREKSPGVAAFLSFLIPGVGQIYAGKAGRGAVVFIGAVVLLFFSVFLYLIPSLLYWLWNIYDAYAQARLYNSKRPSIVQVQAPTFQPPSQPILNQPQPQQYQPVQVREVYRETVREIVKVPCKSCGAIFDQTSLFCPNCGSPRK